MKNPPKRPGARDNLLRAGLVDVGSALFDPPEPDRPLRRSLAAKQKSGSSSASVIKTAILGEYIYASIALILGLSAIIGGSVLCLYGVTGHTSLTASLLGLSTNLNDAAPGVVLFVVGLFMIWATRPKVKLGRLADKGGRTAGR
jgi:hypothetical protein